MSGSGLAVEGLTVSYGQHTAVEDVSFAVTPGERFGVVGPNGAGKSTLLKTVVGLLEPRTGHARVDGLPAAEGLRQIAYLPQRVEVDWSYPARVEEVVAMGRYAHHGFVGRRRAADRAAVSDALKRMGIGELRRRPIGRLSIGQQQRTLIARAFAQGARVMLLDEPYASVDAATAEVIDAELGKAADNGVTVVVVNHDLASLRRRYDRLALIRRRLIAVGAPDEVLTRANLERAYGSGTVFLDGEGPA